MDPNAAVRMLEEFAKLDSDMLATLFTKAQPRLCTRDRSV